MAGSHESHSGSTRIYLIIGAILAIVTVVEVLVALIGLDPITLLAILLVLSFIKGALVVMFFMHLRGDARVFQFLFIVPFLIAVSMILIFLTLFSNHVGIAG